MYRPSFSACWFPNITYMRRPLRKRLLVQLALRPRSQYLKITGNLLWGLFLQYYSKYSNSWLSWDTICSILLLAAKRSLWAGTGTVYLNWNNIKVRFWQCIINANFCADDKSPIRPLTWNRFVFCGKHVGQHSTEILALFNISTTPSLLVFQYFFSFLFVWDRVEKWIVLC